MYSFIDWKEFREGLGRIWCALFHTKYHVDLEYSEYVDEAKTERANVHACWKCGRKWHEVMDFLGS